MIIQQKFGSDYRNWNTLLNFIPLCSRFFHPLKGSRRPINFWKKEWPLTHFLRNSFNFLLIRHLNFENIVNLETISRPSNNPSRLNQQTLLSCHFFWVTQSATFANNSITSASRLPLNGAQIWPGGRPVEQKIRWYGAPFNLTVPGQPLRGHCNCYIEKGVRKLCH